MKRSRWYSLIGILTGGLLFIAIYGVNILNPCYVDWLLGHGDLSQHYIGWELFRQGEWQFPIGLTDQAAYPIRTSVIFTDSIPVFAVLFKIIRCILPQNFQYFGIWGVLCFCLQGLYAMKIFRQLQVRLYISLLGTIIIVLSPVMIYRLYMHTSLAAHWLLLLAIYLYLRHDEDYFALKKIALEWFGLGILTASVHLYFLPMLLFIVIGYAYLSISSMSRKHSDCCMLNIWHSCLPVVMYLVAVVCTTWILGGFVSGASASAGGVGKFNANLNALFNPRGYSSFLHDLGGTEAQHEGFAYLGLGLIILSVIALISVAAGLIKKNIAISAKGVILAVICVASTLFAVSTEYTWGNVTLFTIPVPQKIVRIWSIFRSTGRYIWMLWYMIAISSIVIIERIYGRIKKYIISSAIIAGCVIVQILDLHNILIQKHDTFSSRINYEYLEEDFWRQVMEKREFKHIYISIPDCSISDYMEIGAIAVKYDLSMSYFYFARDIEKISTEEAVSSVKDDTIYFFPKEYEGNGNMNYYVIGKYIIGISKIEEAESDFEYKAES